MASLPPVCQRFQECAHTGFATTRSRRPSPWPWASRPAPQVVRRGRLAQTCGGIFRQNVALRHAQHLESDHELLYCRRPQKRRIKVRMEVLLSARSLMKPHGVRKAGLEEIVVTDGQLTQDIGQPSPLCSAELRQLSQWFACQHQRL